MTSFPLTLTTIRAHVASISGEVTPWASSQETSISNGLFTAATSEPQLE